jgi:hypothetical protein
MKPVFEAGSKLGSGEEYGKKMFGGKCLVLEAINQAKRGNAWLYRIATIGKSRGSIP